MKKGYLFFLFALLCFLSFSCGGNSDLGFIIENNEAALNRVSADLEEIIIPDEVKGHKVTKISSAVFYDCEKLKSVTLGKNIKTISNLAFSDCASLEEVILNDDLESIGQYAFNKCINLERVTIKSKVKEIGGNPFIGCSSLEEIEVIDNEWFETIDGVLFSKKDGTLISYPVRRVCEDFTYTIPSNTKVIGENAFCGTSYISRILLNDDLVEIGNSAFSECLFLEEVVTNNKLEKIGKKAFYKCSKLETIDLSSVKEIEAEAFYGLFLKSVVFGNNLEVIRNGAFALTLLENVTLTNISVIEDRAFLYCPNLVSIKIPSTINMIGANFISYGEGFKLESIFTDQDNVLCLKEMVNSELKAIVKPLDIE